MDQPQTEQTPKEPEVDEAATKEWTSQSWGSGAVPEWQVIVGRTTATHIFYDPADVKAYLKRIDLATHFDPEMEAGEIVISVRKVVRHNENIIRIRTQVRVEDKDAAPQEPAAEKAPVVSDRAQGVDCPHCEMKEPHVHAASVTGK